MLKNKYFAIAISIVAIVFVLRTVFILKKKKYPQIQNQPHIVVDKNTQSLSPLTSKPQGVNGGLENKITPETLYKPVKIEEIEIPEVNSLKWGDDPFYQETSKIEIKEENVKYLMVSLEGIVFSGGKKKAIINGKILEEGESYGGVYIKEIKDESIVIFVNGREQEIEMFEKVSIPIKSNEIGGGDEK